MQWVLPRYFDENNRDTIEELDWTLEQSPGLLCGCADMARVFSNYEVFECRGERWDLEPYAKTGRWGGRASSDLERSPTTGGEDDSRRSFEGAVDAERTEPEGLAAGTGELKIRR